MPEGHGIRQYDHPLRFIVPSLTTHGQEYLVDLSSFRFNGRCQCPHFTFRCEPQLSRGAIPSTLLRCNHIEQARDHFIEKMFKQIKPHLTPDTESERAYTGGF